MCTRTRQKRERPSVPLTTRIDIPVADRLTRISEETGMALSMRKIIREALRGRKVST